MICEGIENPSDATLFALAPAMVVEIYELRAVIADLETRITKAVAELAREAA